jgi:hypothetical protein
MTVLTLSHVRPSLGPNMTNPLGQHDPVAIYQEKFAAPAMVKQWLLHHVLNRKF